MNRGYGVRGFLRLCGLYLCRWGVVLAKGFLEGFAIGLHKTWIVELNKIGRFFGDGRTNKWNG